MKKETKSQEHDTTETTPNTDYSVQNQEQEINYDLVCSGPLYYDPRHIKPGYVPLFVADRAGEVDRYKQLGYEIVLDEFNVGQDVASKSSKFGSAITVQSKCGVMLVLMAIRQDLYDKYEAHKHKKSVERMQGLGKIDNVDDKYQQHNGQKLGYFKTN